MGNYGNSYHSRVGLGGSSKTQKLMSNYWQLKDLKIWRKKCGVRIVAFLGGRGLIVGKNFHYLRFLEILRQGQWVSKKFLHLKLGDGPYYDGGLIFCKTHLYSFWWYSVFKWFCWKGFLHYSSPPHNVLLFFLFSNVTVSLKLDENSDLKLTAFFHSLMKSSPVVLLKIVKSLILLTEQGAQPGGYRVCNRTWPLH